ncbi:MAG: (Fe-S)-binding protein [bacterium]|nr:(Fe-S)-binding protein [bacterium]
MVHPVTDPAVIKKMLKQKKRMKVFLSMCASCGTCADSCFYFRKHKDPKSTPAYKALNSLGRIFKKKGKVSLSDLENMKELIWGKCVLCRRCSCPLGIDISAMIAWARAICRSQGVYEQYDKSVKG